MTRLANLTPLRQRNFRLLFSGQLISDLGDWLSFLGLITIIAYRWELGAGALAALSVAMIIPNVVSAPFAGVLVDRWPYRTVMITADLIRAVLVLGLVFAPNLPVMLAILIVGGIVTTFFSPARQAAIRYTVPEDDLLPANALSQLSLQASKVVGPAIGGLIVAVASPQAAFVVDSVTYLASALILSRLPNLKDLKAAEESAEEEMAASGEAEAEATPAAKTSFWKEFKAGLDCIFKTATLRTAVISITLAMFIIFTFDALGALAFKELNIGEELLGLAVGFVGLGTAIGAIFIGQWGKRIRPLNIMALGNLAGGFMVTLVGIAVVLKLTGLGLGLLPIWLIIGLTGAAMFVPYGFIIQSETPPELIGRVASTASSIQTTFQLLAPPVGALLASVLGIGYVFAIAGAALAVLGLGMLLLAPRSTPAPQIPVEEPKLQEVE